MSEKKVKRLVEPTSLPFPNLSPSTQLLKEALGPADSGAMRKGFRGERENDSGVKTNTIPG
jgi:hypothetical protein